MKVITCQLTLRVNFAARLVHHLDYDTERDRAAEATLILTKVFQAFLRDGSEIYVVATGKNPDEIRLVNHWGLSRKHIFDYVKGSAKLGLTSTSCSVRTVLWHELYFISTVNFLDGVGYRFSYNTPIEEMMQACTTSPGHAEYAPSPAHATPPSAPARADYMLTHILTPFVSMQSHYNLM
ncbi:hypothetical protein NM688_g5037 [Phlebia brevispora]|uniref:Uncharacterized protein n=1 Tax=Phlebia brevispora TaxID=194682 RepID=A0ACC1T1H1_9APHY|nr:hypothetical protein NM688_g5037 [Phlebia brevispora]